MWSTETQFALRNKGIMTQFPSKTDSDPTKLARCNTYGINATDVAVNTGISGGSKTRDYLLSGWSDRIRQNAEIRKAVFKIGNLSSIDSLKLTLWRRNSTGLFDRVGITENLVSKLTDGVVNTVLFDTVLDAELGDYWGYQLQMNDTDWVFHATTGLGSNYALRQGSGILDDTDVAWFSETVYANLTVDIELWCEAPQIGYCGDSLIAGHVVHDSFIESGSEFEPEQALPYKLTKLLSGDGTMATYQNMGIGGQTVEAMKNRFVQDIINANVAMAIMDGPLNDIANGRTEEQILADLTTIIGYCQTAGIPLFMLLGIPLNDSTTDEARLIDTLNASIKTLFDSYDNVDYIDPTSFLSKERTGGDAGNRWTVPDCWIDQTDPQLVHLNPTGQTELAKIIDHKIKSLLA